MSLRFLVITALITSAGAAIAPSAGAQATSAVQSLAGPRTLRVISHLHTENSCSQSWGTSDADLTVALSIDAAGAAALSIDGQSRSLIGSRSPSGGGTSETGHAVRGVARGRASVGTDGRLTVVFGDIDVASAYWSGPGTAPVGPSETQPFVHTLRCTVETAALLPAGAPSPGEVATSTTLAHCLWDGGVPSQLTGYAEQDIWLGAGTGVEERRAQTMFDGPELSLRAR